MTISLSHGRWQHSPEHGRGRAVTNEDYTSIDPKQLQNDSFRPISVKNRFLGTPYFHPKSKLLDQ